MPSEHRYRIVPQPGGNEIETFTVPAAREPTRKAELARGMRDVPVARAGKGYSLHRAKQLGDVAKVAPRPDDRRFHACDLGR